MLLEDSRAVFPFFFPDTLATMKAINDYKCVSIRGPPITYIDILNHPDRPSKPSTTLVSQKTTTLV